MIIRLTDPRGLDRPHSLEHHRPDLYTSDTQVDAQWSYAEAPGGWAVPPAPAPVPELSTLIMLVVGFAILMGLKASKRPPRMVT